MSDLRSDGDRRQTVLSIAVSVIVTTAPLGLLYKPLEKNWDEAAPEAAGT